VAEEATSGMRSGAVSVGPAEIQQLADQLERLNNLIESLSNRTNTLVHLLDILSKRVDRLESRAGI
jgi:ubiquinone biosynthesis protein UbiJ